MNREKREGYFNVCDIIIIISQFVTFYIVNVVKSSKTFHKKRKFLDSMRDNLPLCNSFILKTSTFVISYILLNYSRIK